MVLRLSRVYLPARSSTFSGRGTRLSAKLRRCHGAVFSAKRVCGRLHDLLVAGERPDLVRVGRIQQSLGGYPARSSIAVGDAPRLRTVGLSDRPELQVQGDRASLAGFERVERGSRLQRVEVAALGLVRMVDGQSLIGQMLHRLRDNCVGREGRRARQAV